MKANLIVWKLKKLWFILLRSALKFRDLNRVRASIICPCQLIQKERKRSRFFLIGFLKFLTTDITTSVITKNNTHSNRWKRRRRRRRRKKINEINKREDERWRRRCSSSFLASLRRPICICWGNQHGNSSRPIRIIHHDEGAIITDPPHRIKRITSVWTHSIQSHPSSSH